MAEYIERERLKEAFNEDIINTMQTWDPLIVSLLMIEIDEAPAADVAPVRHGRWIVHGSGHDVFECSLCHDEIWDEKTPYCPYCGTKMDLEDE